MFGPTADTFSFRFSKVLIIGLRKERANIPKEKEAYRDNLERIIARYPNREILTYKQTADYLGVCERTVKKYFKDKKFGGIPIVLLARMLS